MMYLIVLVAQAGLNRSPWTIIGLIILILDVAVIISVVAGRGTAAHKLLWSVIVLVLPLAGLLLYFTIGRSRADRPLME